MLSLLFSVIALNGPWEVHRLQLVFSYDCCFLGHCDMLRTNHIQDDFKQLNKLFAALLDCSLAILQFFLRPSFSSIKLLLSKLGELVTLVLNPSSLPLLNHPPSKPLSLSWNLCVLSAAFTLRLLRCETCCWPLSWGTLALAAVLTDTHRHIHTQTHKTTHGLISLLCLTVFYTWTRTHTQFPGNHPNFPSIIWSHTPTTTLPCATQRCSTFLLSPSRRTL